MKSTPGGSADDMVQRVRCEFLEMPGLRLTEKQAGRLWGLDPPFCSAVLRSLVEAGFLLRTRDGAYVRVDHAMAARGYQGTSRRV